MLGVVLAATAAAGDAVPVLGDGQAVVEELVADQRTFVPCRLPVEFTSFRYPSVEGAGNVTFIGDDPYYRGGGKFGIFRSDAATGRVTTLVGNEGFVGGTSANFREFLGLQTDGPRYVFRGWAEGIGGGIYADFGDGLRAVADGRTVAPGSARTFRNLAYAAISGSRVVFTGEDADGVTGIFLYEHSKKSLRRLADTRSRLADGSGISYFNGQPWLDAKRVVFRGKDEEGRPSIYSIRLPVGTEPRIERVFGPSTALPVPVEISTLTSAPFDWERIAFRASGQLGGRPYEGIFLLENGGVRVVADSETELPDAGVRFRSFNKWIALQNGLLFFRGKAADGFEGLYALDIATNELHQLVTSRDEIEGRRISSFEIASRPVVGDRIAFLAVFEDGKDAIYLGRLRKVGATR